MMTMTLGIQWTIIHSNTDLSDNTLASYLLTLSSIFKVFDNSRASVTSSAMKRDAGESLGNSLFTLEILSPALFDMLRCIFSNANKHSCALFTLSVEIWLLYLQPWTTGRKGESLDLNKWKLYIGTTLFYSLHHIHSSIAPLHSQ